MSGRAPLASSNITKSSFIPPPIDGLELISDPSNYKITEARTLDNYYVYDWGIRERGEALTVATPGNGTPLSILPFTNATYQGAIIAIQNAITTYIYRYVPSTQTWTMLVSGTSFSNGFEYQKRLFLPRSAANEIATYDLGTDTYAATSFTMGASFFALGGCVFKNRCYFWNANSAVVSYGGPGSVTGAVSTFDFGQIFHRGYKTTFCAAWSYNQGVTNDELFVVGNEAGEILIYSGDYPAAANWQLVTRTTIPAPIVRLAGPPGFAPVRLAQELVVNTNRGIVPLSQVFAGRNDDASYYALNRKLGAVLQGAQGARSTNYPFGYWASDYDLYVLNYERSAWSRFPGLASGSTFISTIGVTSQPINQGITQPVPSYVMIGVGNSSPATIGSLVQINEGATAGDVNATYTWETPYFNFGDASINKRAVRARLIGRDLSSTKVAHALTMRVDFDDTNVLGGDTKSQVVASTDYIIKEFTTTANSRWLSYNWSKSGGTEMNEVGGFEATVEPGGAY